MSAPRSRPDAFNEAVIREFRERRGIVGGELGSMSLLLLTTIAGGSGHRRTTPLAYYRQGGRYLVAASNGGATPDPAWFRRVERDTDVLVEVGEDALRAKARVLRGSERDAAFEAIVADVPTLAQYQVKANRTIPIVELETVGLMTGDAGIGR
jgi:deazaflavin-dependent oxidoreductase (nitroreductase family)